MSRFPQTVIGLHGRGWRRSESSSEWLTLLTHFGDLAVLMPLVIFTLLWLLLTGDIRSAAWWAIAVSLCIGLTALSKIFAYTCPPASDLHSPSVHSSMSTFAYWAATIIAAGEGRPVHRIV